MSEEETPEIFTNEELEAAGETDEELSVFSSDEVPEFNDAPDEAMAAAENEHAGEIDLTTSNKVVNGVYTISSAGDYKFTCSQETANRIVVDGANILAEDNIKIYLDNVNINTPFPALQIQKSVQAQVYIYLEGINKLNSRWDAAALQKDNAAKLTIDNSDNSSKNIGKLIATASSGAGIGGGQRGSGSNITISGGSVTATSSMGAGIGGGFENTGSNITISGGSVTATSTYGAGIGSGEDGGTSSNITINGGSVNATSYSGAGIGCPPHQNLNSTGNNPEVYLCTVSNPQKRKISIDNVDWKTYNHVNGESVGDNLYAWLTGAEHTITVGTEERKYSFNQNTKQFSRIKTDPTAAQFDYTQHNFIYTKDTPADINNYIKWKDDVTGHGTITNVTYFKGETSLTNSPTDAGTYTFKIDVNEGEFYNSGNNISASEWKFVISKAQAPSNKPTNPAISVPWSCKKVNEIVPNPLPENWEWQDSDKTKDLNVGDNTATAVYTGEDANKGNYDTEVVTYTITRKACTHEHTAGRYYSSPSCTSSGYSGDTYCTDCNKTLSYGYTISAYGHDYDNGVITTEPTTETDGIITYTCKRCKHQDTKNLGKLGDGEPYIEGSFQKKGWDAVNDLIKASKEKDTISIIMNGAKTLPASVLSGIKGKDISLNLDMENGFIWKINGTSITAETSADTDLSVTNTAEYIPVALYSLISTNQNDFGFHLGRNGAFDFPAVLSVKADASCAGLMANLFWYDVENGVLQCIQTVTVGGAFERSIPYADFTLSKGQDYFIAFGTESLNGRVIHTDGSITDENGAYLRPADTKISSHSIDRNKLTVKLSKGCAGAQGYDFVISKKSNMLQTGKFSKKVSSTGKPQASFRYLAKGTWYVAARSWVLDTQGNKVYGSWTKIKKIKITVVTPQQPKIRNITVKGNTVTVTYTKCKNATGYEILLGNKYKTSAGEKYPVKKYVKRTEGKNTVTVTFTNVKKGTWYVTVRSWNRTSKNKSRVYSPYSTMKKFKTKK